MSQVFRGESRNKVDNKGRVSIPADYRRVLELNDPDWRDGQNARVVIVYGLDHQKYLECYTVAAMRGVEERILAMPRGTPKRRFLELNFITSSTLTSVDETGRLVLTQKLRDKIGVTDTAYFASGLDTFQIWNPDAFDVFAQEQAQKVMAEVGDIDPAALLAEGF